MIVEGISAANLPQMVKETKGNDSSDFYKYLKNELDKVNDTQINAENSTMDLLTGEARDIHQVLIATEEAKLSLELAVQIRNKLVDAYQELIRMQI